LAGREQLFKLLFLRRRKPEVRRHCFEMSSANSEQKSLSVMVPSQSETKILPIFFVKTRGGLLLDGEIALPAS